MAFMENLILEPMKWNFITDVANCLLQFKLDKSTVVYWHEDDADPTAILPSPDMHNEIGILNDGQGNGVTNLDKVYTNTQGALWIYPRDKMSVILLEELV